MKLTPLTKRIAIICLTAGVFVCVICREGNIASMLAGGLLILINPKD